VQYRIINGDLDANISRAAELVQQAQDADSEPGLLVLPAFSFCGAPSSAEEAKLRSESSIGRSVQVLSDFAVRTGKHVVGSYVEHADGDLFHTVALIAPDGTVGGQYRQTHLDPWMAQWASAGAALSVFDTSIGRIGMLACEDVRFPEASAVLAIRRADIIAIPTRWDGSYGGPLHDAGGLFAHQYPENTMAQWYATAKLTQAYTVVANPVDDGCQGSSGIFTINPVDSGEPPVVGSVDTAGLIKATVDTLGDPTWWMNQSRLIGGRRPDLVIPATLDPASEAFQTWQSAPGFDIDSWTAYKA